ncbi:MAG: DUF3416 domain-containing protein, partial [Actinobacteria bacterium]|nr:DUF3416 domain-containing protein [Actinomycetota bacterium]
MPPSAPRKPPSRIRVEHVAPVLDDGRYPIKRTVGERVSVSADIFRDGHEILDGCVRSRGPGAKKYSSTPLHAFGNDRFGADFEVTECGRWEYGVEAWVDRAASWRDELSRKVAAGQEDLASELAEGADILGVTDLDVTAALASTASDKHEAVKEGPFAIAVDRELARFGAWYELFPRSFGGFKGVEKVVPQIAALGFDVVYFPPIHPIGRSGRKGRNNTLPAKANDPGSPWAIGAKEGGHTAVHPDLGTLA